MRGQSLNPWRRLRSYRDGLRANHANVAITWRSGFMVLCISTSSIGMPIPWCSRLGRWKTSWVLHCPLPRGLIPRGGPTETEKLPRLPITQRHGDWHIERPSRTFLRGTCCSNASPDRRRQRCPATLDVGQTAPYAGVECNASTSRPEGPMQVLRRTGPNQPPFDAHRQRASSSATARHVAHTRAKAHRRPDKKVELARVAAHR